MEDILFWTTVVGGTPLVLGLIQLAVLRSREAIHGRSLGSGSVHWQRGLSDSWVSRMHA
jgi:hypothetical protein